jgi:hypothetical protein
MGISDDGALITPKGKRLFRLPMCLAAIVQRTQHWIAKLTWKY